MLKKEINTLDKQTRDKSNQIQKENEAAFQHSKLREIDENISQSKKKGLQGPASQLKTKIKVAAKSLAYLHETKKYASRILEKLTQEKNRILEMKHHEGDSKSVLESAKKEPQNRENLNPGESNTEGFSPISIDYRKILLVESNNDEVIAELEREEVESSQEEEAIECDAEAQADDKQEIEESEEEEEDEVEEEAETDQDAEEPFQIQEDQQLEQPEGTEQDEEPEQIEEYSPIEGDAEIEEEAQLEEKGEENCAEEAEIEAELQNEEETEEIEQKAENLEQDNHESNEPAFFEEEVEQEMKNEKNEPLINEEEEPINLDYDRSEISTQANDRLPTIEKKHEDEGEESPTLLSRSTDVIITDCQVQVQVQEKFVVIYQKHENDCNELEQKEKLEELVEAVENTLIEQPESPLDTHINENCQETDITKEEEQSDDNENTDEAVEVIEEAAVEQSEDQEEQYNEKIDEAEDETELQQVHENEVNEDQDNDFSGEPEEEEPAIADVTDEEEQKEQETEEEEDVVEEPLNKWEGTSTQKSLPSEASTKTADLLFVSRKHINYGTTLPGHIIEESLEIRNRSDQNLVVQIQVDCLNPELYDFDEYIFAIRRSNSNDYNDKHFLIMSPYSLATFKLALKVPKRRMKESIRGETTFTIQGLNDKITLSMETQSVIPKIISPKDLYHTGLKCKVIKLAIKNGKKFEAKIPIKNCSEIPVVLDFEMYEPKEVGTQDPFDCVCSPSSISLDPDGIVLVNLTLNPNYYATIDNEDDFQSETSLIKKVLIARCRDSSLIYSFLILGEIYD